MTHIPEEIQSQVDELLHHRARLFHAAERLVAVVDEYGKLSRRQRSGRASQEDLATLKALKRKLGHEGGESGILRTVRALKEAALRRQGDARRLLLNAGVSPSQASSIIQIKRSRIAAEVAGHRTETRTVRRRRVRRAPPRN